MPDNNAPPPDGSAPPPDGKTTTTALETGKQTPEQWIPEQFQRRLEGKKDGPVDLELSARALAKSYADLAARMKDVGLPPEDAEKYTLDGEEIPKGFDIAELRKDPKLANFLKGAHSKGMTNSQLNYVIGKYLEIAPELAGAGAELSREECELRLATVWKTPEEMAQGLRRSAFAAERLAAFADMSFDDVADHFGNDPMFNRLMAALATQMGEDSPPVDVNAGGGSPMAEFDDQVKSLYAELDKIPEHMRKERQAVLAKITGLFNKRYGTAPQKSVFVSGPKAA